MMEYSDREAIAEWLVEHSGSPQSSDDTEP